MAILLLYRRVFLTHKGGFFDWVLRVFITILTLFYVTTTFVKIWECSPRERIWNRSVPGHCINISSLLNASGLFNSITDLIILLVPVQFVRRLRTSARKKVGVVAVFTVGFWYVQARPILLISNPSAIIVSNQFNPNSAPVFSFIGFAVRLQITSSPDITYNDPEILLWACVVPIECKEAAS